MGNGGLGSILGKLNIKYILDNFENNITIKHQIVLTNSGMDSDFDEVSSSNTEALSV